MSDDPHDEKIEPLYPNQEPKQEIPHVPEFIVIEEEYQERSSSSSEFPHQLKTAKIQKFPFKIRFLCLLIAVFALLWTIGALVSFVFTGCVSLVCLRRNEGFNALTAKYGLYLQRGLVVTLGLLIAMFSPSLGLIMIFSYFLLQGESSQNSMLAAMVRSQFRDYM